MSMLRTPLNLFGASFGIAGLAGTWTIAAGQHRVPGWVGDALLVVAAVVWVVTAAGYAAWAIGHHPTFRADLTDPVAAPFAALAVIVPVLLAAGGIAPRAPVAGAVVVDVFVALTVAHGSWFVGRLLRGRIDVDRLHPGYFLPTVAGGLVGAEAAVTVGQHLLGEVLFGYGLISWLLLGPMILARLLLRPALPAPLLPTLAVQVAPAAVASLAYVALEGPTPDPVLAALAGFGLLMVLAQLPLTGAYLRLPFRVSHWAFTFSWAAVAGAVLTWVHALHPAGEAVLADAVLAAVTLLVGAIGARSVVALARGELLPAVPPVMAVIEPPRRVPEARPHYPVA